MESTAVEKYKEKLCREKCKNAEMHEHQNSIDNFIFYFLFQAVWSLMQSNLNLFINKAD